MKTKILAFSLILLLGFSDLIANLFNSQFYEDQDKWLTNAFGNSVVTDSLVFYPEKYPLDWIIHIWAISIKEKDIYLISVDKNRLGIFEFTPKIISIENCIGLSSAVNEMMFKVNAYKTDQKLLTHDLSKRAMSLDGSTFVLIEYEKEKVIKDQWLGMDLLDYGMAKDLGEKVYSIAKNCH